MVDQNTITELRMLQKALTNFKRVAIRYSPGKSFYKDKLRSLRKEAKSLHSKQNIDVEIKKVLQGFLDIEKPSQKDCNEIVDRLDETIQDLEIELEKQAENFSERIYDKKSAFQFHLDIKEILENATREIFIIEPFVDDHILEITLKDVPKNFKINILTNSKNADKRKEFDKLANLFKNDFDGFEVRETEDLHDRGFFVDSKEGWVMGQSVKDAAKNKPTYLIRLQNPEKLEDIYRKIWNSSKKIK